MAILLHPYRCTTLFPRPQVSKKREAKDACFDFMQSVYIIISNRNSEIDRDVLNKLLCTFSNTFVEKSLKCNRKVFPHESSKGEVKIISSVLIS